MALNTQIRATCLLLLLVSLTSGFVLPPQVRAHRVWAQEGSQNRNGEPGPWEGTAEGSRRPQHGPELRASKGGQAAARSAEMGY